MHLTPSRAGTARLAVLTLLFGALGAFGGGTDGTLCFRTPSKST